VTLRSRHTAPSRTQVRVGAVAFLACILGAGCDRVAPGREEGPRVLELAHDTIRLEAGVRLVEVKVRRQAEGDFDPVAAEVRQGDLVRFIAEDRAGHAIVFSGERLGLTARDFLDQSGQLRGPPLISSGSAWVITLDGAPPGEYPFHCTTHDVAGMLTVVARQE
jgi:plastocyanin